MGECIQSVLECEGRSFSPSQVGAGTLCPQSCDHKTWRVCGFKEPVVASTAREEFLAGRKVE